MSTPSNVIHPVPPTTLYAYRPMAEIVADLLASAPRGSGLIFQWCVSEASYELEPAVIKSQFGDGYAQRRPAGINTQVHKWSISMKNIDAKTAVEVTTWLAARNGVDIFTWYPPRWPTGQNVICPSWSMAYGELVADGSRLFNVNLKFEEVFF